jgi:MFS family permease
VQVEFQLTGNRYTAHQANYLTIPVYTWATALTFLASWASDRYRRRALIAVIAPIFVLIGYAIVLGTPNAAAGYTAMFLCGGGEFPPSHPLSSTKLR